MVVTSGRAPWMYAVLSVLALSSRFDGRSRWTNTRSGNPLSVLALSSRFDGPGS